MSTHTGDDVRGEPRWAAQWLDGDAGSYTVRVAYLPSYWMDLGDGGTSGALCTDGSSIPPFSWLVPDCSGHGGDSEWIRLDVKYDVVSHHWFLADAKYSAHTWHVDFDLRSSDSSLYVSPSSDGGGSALQRNYIEYPDSTVGGYPRSYVADGKHANCPTDAYCDGPGGIGGSDNCGAVRSLARFNVTMSNNLGSRSRPFINCVATQRTDHPAHGLGYQECYWTSQRFRGWFNPAAVGVGAEAHGTILTDHFGF